MQVDLEPPPRMAATEAELLVGVLTGHLVRMLRVAPHLQMLDFTTFAIQVCALTHLCLRSPPEPGLGLYVQLPHRQSCPRQPASGAKRPLGFCRVTVVSLTCFPKSCCPASTGAPEALREHRGSGSGAGVPAGQCSGLSRQPCCERVTRHKCLAGVAPRGIPGKETPATANYLWERCQQ